MKFSEKIVNLRKKSNLSQENAATRLGISRQSLSKWENGECEPNISKLKDISLLYNVSVEFLLNDEMDEYIKEKNNNDLSKEKIEFLVTFIIALTSTIMFIVLNLLPFFINLIGSGFTDDGYRYIRFLESWAPSAIILKVVIFIIFSILYFSLSHIYTIWRRNKNDI